MDIYENRRLKYRTTVNRRGKCLVLRLDDGTILTETLAICQYLEEVATRGISLFGKSALERATIQMWLRRMDIEIAQPLLQWYRKSPESVDYYRGNRPPSPEAQLANKITVNQGFNLMNDGMDDGRQFVCGNRFSLADIWLYSMLKMMGFTAQWLNPTGRTNIHTWMERGREEGEFRCSKYVPS